MRILPLWVLVQSLGCSAEPPAPPPPSEAEGTGLERVGAAACGSNTGCPCPTPGAETECTVTRVSGSYVSCAVGARRCQPDGRWGPCEGGALVWDGGPATTKSDAGSDGG